MNALERWWKGLSPCCEAPIEELNGGWNSIFRCSLCHCWKHDGWKPKYKPTNQPDLSRNRFVNNGRLR